MIDIDDVYDVLIDDEDCGSKRHHQTPNRETDHRPPERGHLSVERMTDGGL